MREITEETGCYTGTSDMEHLKVQEKILEAHRISCTLIRKLLELSKEIGRKRDQEWFCDQCKEAGFASSSGYEWAGGVSRDLYLAASESLRTVENLGYNLFQMGFVMSTRHHNINADGEK